MMKPVILIVDDNPHITKSLTLNLEKEGFSVVHADNGETGLELVERAKPDLIISDVLMPKMDGIAMCEQVRTRSSIPMVPFMFLTAIDADVTQKRGFRAGADHYFVKSEINREELVVEVRKMLKRADKITEIDAAPRASFGGSLSELSLIEILQLLHINKKTGTLTIQRPHYPSAKICVDQGEIIRAELGEELDEKAMFILSAWKRGNFNFVQEPVSGIPCTVKTATHDIIMESFRVQSNK